MTDLPGILNEEEEPEDSEKFESKTEEDGEARPEIQYDDSGEYSDITDEQDITADQSDNIEDNTDRDYDIPDQSTEDSDNGFYDNSEDVPFGTENEGKDDADFNKDMLEDGSDEIEITDNGEMPDDSDIDMYPENEDDIPDPQEFEDMLDSSAAQLSGENFTYDRKELGDYEDMGDFDYLQESDIEPGEPEDPTDAEFSPDNAAEDIGEMAEEIGEAAEEGEAIIAALLYLV